MICLVAGILLYFAVLTDISNRNLEGVKSDSEIRDYCEDWSDDVPIEERNEENVKDCISDVNEDIQIHTAMKLTSILLIIAGGFLFVIDDEKKTV